MRNLRIILMAICAAAVLPAFADSPPDNCSGASKQEIVDCLQPQLDSRIEQADKLFEVALKYVAESSKETPDAGIDAALAQSELRAAKRTWEEFAEHECAAARELVGIGNDRDPVELSCLINLYDQRILELRSWRHL